VDHVVMLKWHVMAGCDVHNEITVVLVPMPMVPHVVGMVLNGLWGASKTSDRTIAKNWNIIQRDSDISYGIIHVPVVLPACALAPLIILTAGSKSYFGPSSVLAEKKPIAGALFKYVNWQLNCADPCPMPTGFVACWGTVVCGMTWGDIIGGFIAMVLDCAIQAVINAGTGAIAKYAGFAAATGKEACSVAAARLLPPFISAAIQQLLGSPVGYTNAPGRDDGSMVNPGNWGTAAGHAAGDAMSGRSAASDPHTEQH
jgi:hypothetical protein